jgi:hypothetical protein
MRSIRQRGSIVADDNAAPLSSPGRIRRIPIRSSDSRRFSPCCAARMDPARGQTTPGHSASVLSAPSREG